MLTSTKITAEGGTVYATLVEKLDGFFKLRRNVIFEQARFNRRDQTAGESIENYITCLYHLAETCKYRAGALKEEMLQDRLVVGIRDHAVSQDAELTLEKAKKTVRQNEAVVQQHQARSCKGQNNSQLSWTKSDAATGDNMVHPRTPRTDRGNNKLAHQNRGGAGPNKKSKPYMRCGGARHSTRNQCPALWVACRKCRRIDHYNYYAKVCLSKTAAAVTIVSEQVYQKIKGPKLDKPNRN